jgi:MFS family permease
MAIDSLVWAMTFSLGLMIPLMSEDLGMSLRQSGWLGSINWMAPAILSIPAATWLARYSPKKLITIATIFEVPLLFAQGWAPNYWILLLSRMAFMAIGLARFPARPLLVQQWFPLEKITMVNSVLTVGMGAAGATAVFFMGDLMEALNGWRNAFYLFGSIQAFILFVWMILGRENPATAPAVRSEASMLSSIKPLAKSKILWLLGVGVTGDMLCFGAMETLWPRYAIPEGIVTLDRASYALGLSYYGFMVGSLLGGVITQKIGRRKPLIWAPGILLPFLTLGILFSHSYSMIALLWALWGVSETYFPVIMTIPYELPGIKPHQVAVATSFIVAVFTAGGALGPIMAGYIADAFGSLKLALGITCAFPFLLFIAGLLIPETGPRARSKSGAASQP